MANLASPPPAAEQAPDFFTGTSFAVDEILLGLNVLTTKVRALKQGNDAGCAVQQKLASEEVGKVAGQIHALADVITRVTITHLNRRPRP